MTTLLAWVSYTTTGESPELPRALYLASDSRISWGGPARRWDAGCKLFASKKEPHIFGYCGDVVFPSHVLAQITAAIDSGLLFSSQSTPMHKHDVIQSLIINSFSKSHATPTKSFWILHAYRNRAWPHTSFSMWQIYYDANSESWEDAELSIPDSTGKIVALGSGSGSALFNVRRWQESYVGGTSRSIFSAFCDTLYNGDDRLSGAPAQLAGLYADMEPQQFGFVDDGKLYFQGLEIPAPVGQTNLPCRDRLFQEIDPVTMKRLAGSRRFARPKIK